jgi:nitrilase
MTSGAVAVAVPSAFQSVTGEAHWETLLRARAIEDQCYVLAAAQWGPWGPPDAGHRTFGNAMIVDPWGEIVARAPADGDGVWLADLDRDRVRSVRSTLPALAHRRLGSAC